MKCLLCETDSCNTKAYLKCCQLRMLAKAPRHIQAAAGAAMTQAERDEMRPLLIAETKRLKEIK